MQQNDTDQPLNQAFPTLIAQNIPVGSWQVLPYNSPVIPIHAALLRTGKVFFIAGSGLELNNVNCRNCTAVWNVANGTFNRPVTPDDDAGDVIDLFCVGHSFRQDGRLMVAGGTLQYNPYLGEFAALVFDPNTEAWTKMPSMSKGRWYPTLVTLGSGRIVAMSGLDENGDLNTYVEVYSTSFSTGWITFSQPTASRFPLYPHLFLLQDGRIFYSGANFEDSGIERTPVVPATILTLPGSFTQAIPERQVPGLTDPDKRNQAASVLLPPAQEQKVMIIGGGTPDYFAQTTNACNIVDLRVSNPTYTPAAPLNYGRMHHNAVLLPDRTVFVCNGTTVGETSDSKAPPEIYNPATNTWTVVAAQSVTRVYHSVALLLPDGRVATGGSTPGFGANNYELRLEVYSPAYMSQPRPTIQNAPQTLSYNRTITIQTPQAANIKWVSLIKPMATTHGLDTEQRVVDLPIASRTSTSLSVTVTNNRNIAPAGWYMLFITDNNNVPSVANWIRLG